jgi:hypothetical protein
VTIVNSTIAHNSSEKGPAAIGVNNLLTIRSSAFVSNRSEAASSAGVAAIELTVRDSIFADNRNATGLLNCSSGTPTSLGGNVSDDDSCGTGPADKPNVNPGLGTLALHGGTTPVYDLLPISLAIDFATQCPPVDQRGVARPQGARCDSGPYEFVPPLAPVVAAPDRELSMSVGNGKLRMNDKGRIRVRLSCPATEVSSPCRGRVRVATLRPGWPLEPCGCTETLMVKYARGRFSIPAGKTKAVVARLPRSYTKRIQDHWKPRKVLLLVSAEDAAGNRQPIEQRRKLAPAS